MINHDIVVLMIISSKTIMVVDKVVDKVVVIVVGVVEAVVGIVLVVGIAESVHVCITY